MNIRKVLSLFFCVLMLCMSIPVYAADSHMNITINPDGNGITINPGRFPNLGTDADTVSQAVGETTINKAKEVAKVITAICAIICLVMWFVNVTKLVASGGSPFIRRQALLGLLYSGIGIALFGGAWIMVSFFWNLFAS